MAPTASLGRSVNTIGSSATYIVLELNIYFSLTSTLQRADPKHIVISYIFRK